MRYDKQEVVEPEEKSTSYLRGGHSLGAPLRSKRANPTPTPPLQNDARIVRRCRSCPSRRLVLGHLMVLLLLMRVLLGFEEGEALRRRLE